MGSAVVLIGCDGNSYLGEVVFAYLDKRTQYLEALGNLAAMRCGEVVDFD